MFLVIFLVKGVMKDNESGFLAEKVPYIGFITIRIKLKVFVAIVTRKKK